MSARRSYGSKRLPQKRAIAALSMLLSGCKLEQLNGFTAQGLAGSYNVPLAKAETMLAAAKMARGL